MNNGKSEPFLFRLPAEIRLQIYEHVIGSRVIYFRMSWTGVCIPSGFLYCCLDNTQTLLSIHQKAILAQAVPFGSDLVVLSQICRQMHRETAVLPFQCYVWAFETAWTLDQFISRKISIPAEHKHAIRMVAVPTPGPFTSCERSLVNLHTVLLVGSFQQDEVGAANAEGSNQSRVAILTLRRPKTGHAWVRSDNRVEFASGSAERHNES